MANVETNELSERELDILKLVATGASNKEIAHTLFISSNTVKVHLRNIFNKIGVTSRTEAAMFAVRIGLVETVSPQVLPQEEAVQSNGQVIVSALPSAYPQPGNKLWRARRYLGIFGGLLLLLIIIGLVYDPWNIIPVKSSTPPTLTPRVQWFQMPALPVSRWALAVTSYDNKIYAIGGETSIGVSNVVESFDPKANAWIELAQKPTAVSDVSAVAIGGLIFAPGGKLASGAPTDVNEIYDPLTNNWSIGKPMPKALSGYALAVYEGRMYLFGGWDGKQVVNNAYVYDHSGDNWTVIPSVPTARSYAGAVVVAGKIYLIGGWDGNQAVGIAEVYHPDYVGEASAWAKAPELPGGRFGMAIANIADIIFIVGGSGSPGNISAIALSPGEDNWGKLESPLQNDWSFLGAATIGTRLYVLGGKTSEGPSSQMWAYQVIFTITLPIVR